MTLLFWRFHNQTFLNNCWFYGRQKVLLSVTALATRRSFTGFAGKLPSSFVVDFCLEQNNLRERINYASFNIIFVLAAMTFNYKNGRSLKVVEFNNKKYNYKKFYDKKFNLRFNYKKRSLNFRIYRVCSLIK